MISHNEKQSVVCIKWYLSHSHTKSKHKLKHFRTTCKVLTPKGAIILPHIAISHTLNSGRRLKIQRNISYHEDIPKKNFISSSPGLPSLFVSEESTTNCREVRNTHHLPKKFHKAFILRKGFTSNRDNLGNLLNIFVM